MSKALVPILVIAGIGGLAYYAYSREESETAPGPIPPAPPPVPPGDEYGEVSPGQPFPGGPPPVFPPLVPGTPIVPIPGGLSPAQGSQAFDELVTWLNSQQNPDPWGQYTGTPSTSGNGRVAGEACRDSCAHGGECKGCK